MGQSMTLMLRRLSDEASSSGIGLAVATTFFAAAFVFAQLTITSDDGKDPRTQTLQSEAESVIDLIVGTEGRAMQSGSWTGDSDNLLRFGLTSGVSNVLDYHKVQALRNGSTYTATTNNAPDYFEVKQALGLKDVDFHLRSYPVLMSIDDARWQPTNGIRAAYIGHYGSPSSPVTITTSTTTTTTKLHLDLTFKNEGTKDAVYTAIISLTDSAKNKEIITEVRHTRLLQPAQSQTVGVDFHAQSNWDSAINSIKITSTDGYGGLAVDSGGADIGETWITGITKPTASPTAYNHLVHSGDDYYRSGTPVDFYLDHYDGKGDRVNNAKAHFVLKGPNGNEWVNTSATASPIDLPKNQEYVHTCSNCTAVGNYTAIIWDTAMLRSHSDTIHVSAANMFTESTALVAAAQNEVQILDELIASFNPTRQSPTNLEGDVFADNSNHPRDLVDLLFRYDTVVVGSEVKQTALNSATVKYAIADWVSLNGGNLVVLGTYQSQSHWLEPVYHASQETAGGGISAPDPTHPILSTPDKLDYQRYLDRGRAWSIKQDQEFTHVLSRGTSGTNVQDTLAVSTPGTLGDGTVVLTSYMPGSLTEPQDFAEAKRLMHNLVSQGYAMLFIDYGPAIPEGVPVASASRLVVVPHPSVEGVNVEARLVLYMFG